MKERGQNMDNYLSFEETKEQLKTAQEFIVSLRDVPVIERGSEVVHFIKTHNLEKLPCAAIVKDMLKKYKIDSVPEFNEEYVINLDFKLNEDCIKFIKATNDSKFTNYRKLTVRNMNYLQKLDIMEMNKFFERSTPNLLKILYLHGGDKADMQSYIEALPAVLRCVEEQIYLDWFILSPDILMQIIERSWKVKELVLNYCKISTLPSTFKLEKNIDYRIESLDLYGTINPHDPDYLSVSQFKVLVRAMSATPLRASLKQFHVFNEAVERKEAQKVFDFYKFDVTVEANKRWAESMS
jgi:hypothetical protein